MKSVSSCRSGKYWVTCLNEILFWQPAMMCVEEVCVRLNKCLPCIFLHPHMVMLLLHNLSCVSSTWMRTDLSCMYLAHHQRLIIIIITTTIVIVVVDSIIISVIMRTAVCLDWSCWSAMPVHSMNFSSPVPPLPECPLVLPLYKLYHDHLLFWLIIPVSHVTTACSRLPALPFRCTLCKLSTHHSSVNIQQSSLITHWTHKSSPRVRYA